MKAEIEAIRGVAGSEAAASVSARAPDTTSGARGQAPRTQAPTEVQPTSPAVGLVFEVSGQSQDLVIKIVDRETRKVIREIPPEEVQAMREAMQSAVGTFLDRTG